MDKETTKIEKCETMCQNNGINRRKWLLWFVTFAHLRHRYLFHLFSLLAIHFAKIGTSDYFPRAYTLFWLISIARYVLNCLRIGFRGTCCQVPFYVDNWKPCASQQSCYRSLACRWSIRKWKELFQVCPQTFFHSLLPCFFLFFRSPLVALLPNELNSWKRL